MKDFLFRGKTPSTEEYFDDGLWTVGYYVRFNGVEHRIYSGYAETDCDDYYPDWDNVIPETVGRYTGLNDIHFERIFEGDIVKLYLIDGIEIGVIKFNDIMCRFMFFTKDGSYSFDNTCKFEIVGNIYDNPELLNN